MDLNIKNDEAHRLAVELAKLRGESMTQAVTTALREQLRQELRRRSRQRRLQDLLDLGRRCARYQRTDLRPHGELLYDENGLPVR